MTQDPLGLLVAQHQEGLKQLDRLGQAAGRLHQAGPSPEVLRDIQEATAFINHEVREHNQKEEEVLFPALEKVLSPQGPTAVMRYEHRQLWETLDRLEGATARLAQQDEAALQQEVITSAQAIVQLLSAHIDKENNVLYPMARQMLSAAQLADIETRLKA